MKSIVEAQSQRGSSLIEVLVTVLVLSIGLLSMGAMLAYAVQLPKESGNRSMAVSIGTTMIDRMRANPSTWNTTTSPVTLSFTIANYATTTFTTTLPSSTSLPSGSTCSFPNCAQANIATEDLALTQQQLNQQLAPAGMTVEVTDAANNEGRLWIIWQSPQFFGSYNTAGSDLCPSAITTLNLSPPPRCVYLPFRL